MLVIEMHEDRVVCPGLGFLKGLLSFSKHEQLFLSLRVSVSMSASASASHHQSTFLYIKVSLVIHQGHSQRGMATPSQPSTSSKWKVH